MGATLTETPARRRGRASRLLTARARREENSSPVRVTAGQGEGEDSCQRKCGAGDTCQSELVRVVGKRAARGVVTPLEESAGRMLGVSSSVHAGQGRDSCHSE